MNRLCKTVLVTQVVVAGVVGTSIWAGSAIAAEPAAAAKVDINRGQQIATTVCVACHAADGNSTSGMYPKLAGQHDAYLYKQLKDFVPQSGAKGAERKNPIMAGMAGALNDQDAHNVAAYFASQTAKPGAAKNPADVGLGEKIWRGGIAEKGVPACASCHGATGAGLPVQYPRLSGQWQDYTVAQLTAFQQGTRANSAPMTTIALRLTDQEIKAVADYAAGLH
ncbi:c-type cytochrome [Pararobbsia silviterrae]|uniref:Cytochrome c4 n=1 Tax=Pararobbsia silviterrae TaxID=1792498 RepID=A0A494X5P8_9BURK|nr:c-type cytochrome [Pararobbsia silviterrae]RKP45700.1 cytochrome c4 [Pararobbsia silviterrae]